MPTGAGARARGRRGEEQSAWGWRQVCRGGGLTARRCFGTRVGDGGGLLGGGRLAAGEAGRGLQSAVQKLARPALGPKPLRRIALGRGKDTMEDPACIAGGRLLCLRAKERRRPAAGRWRPATRHVSVWRRRLDAAPRPAPFGVHVSYIVTLGTRAAARRWGAALIRTAAAAARMPYQYERGAVKEKLPTAKQPCSSRSRSSVGSEGCPPL